MGSSRFYSALAALLFAAACAWTGAALFVQGAPAAMPELTAPPDRESLPLYGIVLRREAPLEQIPPAFSALCEGQRLSPGDFPRLEEPALFFSCCDGYEYLGPETLQELTVDRLEALLAAKPGEKAAARLVFGHDFLYAAFSEKPAELKEGCCRLRFEGFEESCPAEIIDVCRNKGRTALLLRLTQGGSEYMELRFAKAELLEYSSGA